MKDDNKLSSEQIENWRRVLSMMVGPYAYIMPEAEIQRHRDSMQKQVNKIRPDIGRGKVKNSDLLK